MDNKTCTRGYLLQQLRILMDYSMQKTMTRQTTAKEKPRWARIAVSCASAAGSILRDEELNNLAERIAKIEAQIQ